MRIPSGKGKHIGVVLIVFATVVVAIASLRTLHSRTKELRQLRAQQQEMALLKDEFLSLREKVGAVEGKKNLASVQGVLQAVDEVFSSIGLRDRVKTVRIIRKNERKDGTEEEAEVFVEKVSMNEMVNLFYRIEHAPMVLSIRRVAVKQAFDRPELLNMELALSFLKSR